MTEGTEGGFQGVPTTFKFLSEVPQVAGAPLTALDEWRYEQDAARQAAQVKTGDLYDRAVYLDHSVTSFIQGQHEAGANSHYDPQWKLPQTFMDDLRQRGIPDTWADEFATIGSQYAYDYKLNILANRANDEATLAAAGGRGFAMRMVANATDPVGVAVDAAASFAGGAGAVNRFRRIVGAGVAAAGTNATMGAIVGQANPDYGVADFGVDLAAGFAFGTLFETGAQVFSKADRADMIQAAQRVADRVRGRGESFGADTASAARVAGAHVDDVAPVADSLNIDIPSTAGGDAWESLTERAAVNHDVSSRFTGIRVDYSAKFAKHDDEVVRQLGRDFLFDPVQRRRGDAPEVNTQGITEATDLYRRNFEGGFKREAEQAFRESAQAAGDDAKRMFDAGYRHTFWQRVGRVAKGFPDTDVHIQRATSALRKTFADVLDAAKRAGVAGADAIEPDPTYFPRIQRRDLMDYLKTRFNSQTEVSGVIRDLIGEGIRRGLQREGRQVDEQLTGQVAEHYTKVLLRGDRDPLNNGHALADADLSYIDEVLTRAGVDQGQIDGILSQFTTKQPSEGQASVRLKPRLVMDETASVSLGDGDVLWLSDLFEGDAEAVANAYIREMSGHIALAEKGYKNWRQVETIIGRLRKEDRIDDAEAHHLGQMLNYTLGRPMENDPTGTWAKAARTVGGLNYLRSMGQVFWSALTEFGPAMSYAGWRSSMRQVPMLKAIVNQVRTGQLPDTLARELAACGEPGTTLLRSTVSLRYDERNLTGLDSNKAFKVADKWSNTLQRVQSIASGLAPITDSQHILMSRAFAQRLYDVAHNANKVTAAELERLGDYGLSKRDLDRLLDHMRTHAKAAGGVLKEIGMAAMPADLQRKAQGFIFRAYRHAILDPDVGSTIPLMHTTMGKLLFQFRSFAINAYTRHSLHAASRLDSTAGIAFATGTAFGALSVLGRTVANYGPNDERTKKLVENPAHLAKSGFQVGSLSSILPMLVDTGADLIGSDPVFGNAGRSTDLASSALMGVPTIDLMKKMYRALGIPANAIRTDKEVSKQDVQALFDLLPMKSNIGIRQFLQWAADDLPNEYELEQ